MTICFPVRPEYVKIIPGVTHVDDTCRVQTVSQGDGVTCVNFCKSLKNYQDTVFFLIRVLILQENL